MERDASWQAQTDTYLNQLNTRICGNDYAPAPGPVQTVRNLFAPPIAGNPDPRPVFVAINCITNLPGRQYREVLIKEFENGGSEIDFTPRITGWRTVLDAVQAPPPRITDLQLTTNNILRFTIPGQRGRINRVEGSTNFLNWTTITNVTGTNAPVIVRDTNVLQNPLRFYRIVRQ